MPTDLSGKTCLFFDFGLFNSFAQKLGESFGRVLYYCEYKRGFSLTLEKAIGQGMPNIERVDDFFDHVDEADVIVFPDIQNGDLQQYLRVEGKRVWGSGKAEELETNRADTKKYLEKIGLPMNKWRKVTGIRSLKEHLKNVEDKWIKTEGCRGDGETWHFQNYKLSEPRLNEMEFKLGIMGDERVFIVEDPIDSVAEWGYDGFTIDGQFAETGIMGIEKKNEAYVGIVRPYEKILPQLRNVNKRLAPALKGYEYRGLYSSEVRITKDGTGYFIDPCCRGAAPGGGSYQNLITNWGEIVWHGSNGELIEPDIDKGMKYSCEVLINCENGSRPWANIYFPKEIEHCVKLRNAVRKKGNYAVSNQEHGIIQMGTLVTTGKTFLDPVKLMADYAKQIEGDGIEVMTKSLCGAIDQIRKSAEMGWDVADDPIPSEKAVYEALGK
jgi:hypothetical protein